MYSLSLLDVNSHAEETSGGDGVWGFPAVSEPYSLFSSKNVLQICQRDIYSSNQL